VSELVERHLLLQITPELVTSIQGELEKDLQHMLRKKLQDLNADQWKFSEKNF
jgi:hypothetical protein